MACALDYTFTVTGDCSNNGSGGFTLTIIGNAPDYSIQWIDPVSFGSISLNPGVSAYTKTNLTSGTYTFDLIDSCSPTNTIQTINIYVSSGTTVSVVNYNDTSCGLVNGDISVNTTNSYNNDITFYLYDNTYGLIQSANTTNTTTTFSNLSASTYYVVGNDGGGCTGQSQTVIIKSSTTVSYDLLVINDAGCAVNSGKIFVNNVVGFPPYTYFWSNSATTSSITGLTTGTYSVTVTDSNGCSVTKSGLVEKVPPVGIAAVITEAPGCFSYDGEVTVYITGGTAPYLYSGSTSSNNGPSFDDSYTFTNLGSGLFNFRITDAGLCNVTGSTYLTPPGGFSVSSINTTNSTCGLAGGAIEIVLFGGTKPFKFKLTKPDGNNTVQTTDSPSWSFPNLVSGTYTLTIEDGSPCIYTNTFVIENDPVYVISAQTTGATCNLETGIATISLSGGEPNYTYVLDGGPEESGNFSSVTFNYLSPGPHTVEVTDGSGCNQSISFSINSSSGVDFTLTSTDAIGGNNGTIQTSITQGEPPFTLSWSSNVNGQTGLTVTNLSAGTYTLTITDSNGCIKTRTVVVDGNVILSSYLTYEVCDSDLVNSGALLLKGPKQMLLEGFYELNIGNTNCILNEAIFEAVVTVNGVTTTDDFYTGTTLNEYPTIEQWVDAVEGLLSAYEGLGEVTFDIEGNGMKITSDCNSEVSLTDAGIDISMKIYYDISCQECPTPP